MSQANSVPLRILRAQADAAFPPPPLNRKQQDLHDRTLDIAELLLAANGQKMFSFGKLAQTLRVGIPTLRRIFSDLEEITGKILHRHLVRIGKALAEVSNTAPPEGAPDVKTQRQDAYRRATRGLRGAPTRAHLILIRDLPALPDDVRDPLEDFRLVLGAMLCTDGDVPATLARLDDPLHDSAAPAAPPPEPSAQILPWPEAIPAIAHHDEWHMAIEGDPDDDLSRLSARWA